MDTDLLLIFLLASFALAGVVIMKRESIPPPVRRPLAIVSLLMVASSFAMLVIAFFQLGQ